MLSSLKKLFTAITTMRFRHVYMVIFSTLVLLAMVLTDPDSNFIQSLPFGAYAVASLVVLSQCVLLIVFFHISRLGLFDYIRLWDFFKKSLETSDGASRALIAFAIMMYTIAQLIIAGIQKW